MSDWKAILTADLKLDEGFRQHPYLCSAGHSTIGYGRNLDANGINQEEAEFLLKNNIQSSEKMLMYFSWFDDLSDNRKRALTNMVFNLGYARFSQFKKMLRALAFGRFEVAAVEALNSTWAKQVGERANRIARLIEVG